jgi:hypothetical protein
MPTAVSAVPAAPSAEAEAHFGAEFTFETDCWDVWDSTSKGADFVLLDVRSPTLYAKGHVPGAINLPHGKIVTSKMEQWPADTLFVVYCAGLQCISVNADGTAGLKDRSAPQRRPWIMSTDGLPLADIWLI